ncbi:myb/SANT-like DNA-binding domain-containing protein 3, partial [Diabrotica virgifera virgifera]|uniref:Regulatory protein zeste n=1 Tax=Diabrotica virgifera virgifera TaxID=50390 RepID=A0ABM5L1J6_DIAVI
NRSTNFSKGEELLLLQEIEKYKSIVECQATNKVNSKEKEEAWQKILSNFNSKNLEFRTVGQIKNKYDNFKTRSRKIVASEKTYLRGTGGGPPIKTVADPVVEATLNIINGKTVVGHITMIDSDETIPWENIPSTSIAHKG